ncbi:Methylcrotonoyl-CoA carboxylase subunit alpha, mitochondrial [Tolypocladium ophioglossoides CBS 100239]|uniref:Methylcrotonoyl-CoA carboxylase subunit alpha, mitochondrial n=1 Tax=Tolypocladium ophioglossoides (strain CBS 100239) TaxID=1163406 RepID=A0A0L0N0G7_TOLOC|nr:Methylcrotonoyl-CoA carboxylase subunit alpha, mitochondrial [Tolypocladium ophioglossoides CBS 100239]
MKATASEPAPVTASTMSEPPPLFVAPLPLDSTGSPRLRRLLIANRGEIACRVIETCRKLNITSIAVYVDEDATSQHIVLADESIGLGSIEQGGGNPYLNVGLLVRIAVDAGADAIHPGYGYLSENAQFATAVRDAGLTFVGPAPNAMLTLGDKRSAKEYLLQHDPTVPLIPGFAGASQQSADLERAADRIGYPIMLKASAGGGGKGMRIVRERSQLLSELERAQSEAARFFGSSDCILEKYIKAGKHIEIQILGDIHGNVLSLGERDCSVQRRHQKVIEETPSPWLDEKKRQEMSAVAVRIGKLLKYENAGTVEFVFDVATNDFYFLEVNTRLQVEHPITEEVTRLDIVSLQLFVASGGDLASLEPLKRVRQRGHAIECRLCAEDPQRDFYPGHGVVRLWRPADLGPLASHVRFETAVATGSRISIHFDPMIAKLVVWAPTRALARASMVKVLTETACVGVVTNQLFLLSCLLHDSFSDPGYTTSFIPKNLEALLKSPYAEKNSEISAGLPLLVAYILSTVSQRRRGASRPFSNIRLGFRNQAFDPVNDARRHIVVTGSETVGKSAYVCSWTTPQQVEDSDTAIGTIAPMPDAGQPQSATARYNLLSNSLRAGALPGQQKYSIMVKCCQTDVASPRPPSMPWIQATFNCILNGKSLVLHLATESRENGHSGVTQTAEGARVLCHVPLLGTWYDATSFSTLSYFENIREKQEAGAGQGKRVIAAPMPCKVLSVLKQDGETVKAGEKVIVVESMKMEINVFASVEGTFRAKVREQDAVDEGKVLCVVE